MGEHPLRYRTRPKNRKPGDSKTANIISRQILAKGTTANVTALIEVKDPKEIKRYGTTPEEIQLDIFAVLSLEETVKAIEQLPETMEALKTQSTRIEEKEYENKDFTCHP